MPTRVDQRPRARARSCPQPNPHGAEPSAGREKVRLGRYARPRKHDRGGGSIRRRRVRGGRRVKRRRLGTEDRFYPRVGGQLAWSRISPRGDGAQHRDARQRCRPPVPSRHAHPTGTDPLIPCSQQGAAVRTDRRGPGAYSDCWCDRAPAQGAARPADLRPDRLSAARAPARGRGVHVPRHGAQPRSRARRNAHRHPDPHRKRLRVALARGDGAAAGGRPLRRRDPEAIPTGAGGSVHLEAAPLAARRPGHLEGPRLPPPTAAARHRLLHPRRNGAQRGVGRAHAAAVVLGGVRRCGCGDLRRGHPPRGAPNRAPRRGRPVDRHPRTGRARPPLRVLCRGAARHERRPRAHGSGLRPPRRPLPHHRRRRRRAPPHRARLARRCAAAAGGLALTLRVAEQRAAAGDPEAGELVRQAGDEAGLALTELRDLARGIHPAILTNRGLRAALEDLAARATVPVEVAAAPEGRLADPVEATAYFVVSECLANVGKHAGATSATVDVTVGDGRLIVTVSDDGAGGADLAAGSGLQGLQDRVGALDGSLEVESPAGGGTRVAATIPLVVPEPAADYPHAVRSRFLPDDEAAARQSERVRRLRIRCAVFGVAGLVLIAVWAFTGASTFWPIWPLLGLGLVAGLDAWRVLAAPPPRESDLGPDDSPDSARAFLRRRRLVLDAGALGIVNLTLIGLWLA